MVFWFFLARDMLGGLPKLSGDGMNACLTPAKPLTKSHANHFKCTHHESWSATSNTNGVRSGDDITQ